MTANYLYGSGGTDSASAILRTDVLTVEGTTYEVEFQTGSSGNPDNGFLFGAQSGQDGWSTYTGYLILDNNSAGECQLQRWSNGSRQETVSGSQWPRDERLTLEIDYRDTSSQINCTVYDSTDTAVVSLSMDDQTYGDGYPGFYHWRDDAFEVYEFRDPSAQDFREITVNAGETFSKTLANGETWENILIDISADGATFDIEADGADWTIRNLGIRGQWDGTTDVEPLSVAVDSGSTGRIENFYFADGVPDTSYPGVTGIYAYKHHAGDLTIENTNIQGMADNAVYASAPGRPPDSSQSNDDGAGGTTTIRDSFAADCNASHFRVGSSSDRIENCVAVGDANGDRGIWARFNDIEAVNCDLSGHNQGDVAVGTNEWSDGQNAVLSVTDCWYETTDTSLDYQGTVNGSANGAATRTSPSDVDGVPLTAEEAARGEGSGSGTGPTPSGIDGYNVYFDGTLAAELVSSVTTTTIEQLSPGTQYEIEVRAVRGDLESDPATLTVTTQPEQQGDFNLDDWHQLPATQIHSPQEITQDLPTSDFDLEPNTTYEYVLHATDRLGEEGYTGDIREFTTGSLDEEPGGTDPEPDPVGIFDSFEHQNLQSYYDGQNVSDYEIMTRWSTDGSYSVRNSTNAPGQIWSSDLPGEHPQSGDLVRFDMASGIGSTAVDNTHRLRIQFGQTSEQNFFGFYIDLYENDIYAIEARDGNWTILDSGNCHNIVEFTSMYAELNWISSTEYTVQFFNKADDNTISDQLHALAANHAAQTGGVGMAMRSRVGRSWYTDNWRITARKN